jgi:hypothetical protein
VARRDLIYWGLSVSLYHPVATIRALCCVPIVLRLPLFVSFPSSTYLAYALSLFFFLLNTVLPESESEDIGLNIQIRQVERRCVFSEVQ